jgi:hypothetical protein
MGSIQGGKGGAQGELTGAWGIILGYPSLVNAQQLGMSLVAGSTPFLIVAGAVSPCGAPCLQRLFSGLGHSARAVMRHGGWSFA